MNGVMCVAPAASTVVASTDTSSRNHSASTRARRLASRDRPYSRGGRSRDIPDRVESLLECQSQPRSPRTPASRPRNVGVGQPLEHHGEQETDDRERQKKAHGMGRRLARRARDCGAVRNRQGAHQPLHRKAGHRVHLWSSLLDRGGADLGVLQCPDRPRGGFTRGYAEHHGSRKSSVKVFCQSNIP
jgi:hypothetical protein